MRFETVLNPPEIDHLPHYDLSDAVCVVFDILRATTSIVTGLSNGMREIYPVATIEDALELKQRLPHALLGGERFGELIPGFQIGNSPLEYRDHPGATVITTTTNGTIALRAPRSSREVLAASFLNFSATIEYLSKVSPARVIAICAGTFRNSGFEDILAAGALADALATSDLCDSTLAAVASYEKWREDLLGGLFASENGRLLLKKGRAAEVEWSAQMSIYPIVVRDDAGALKRVDAASLPPCQPL